jgi:hypothetical protein
MSGIGVHPVNAPTLELLSWLAARRRTYGETIDAWRSNCPRLSAWEDAVAGGLVRVVRGGDASGELEVALTPRGRALLEAEAARL